MAAPPSALALLESLIASASGRAPAVLRRSVAAMHPVVAAREAHGAAPDAAEAEQAVKPSKGQALSAGSPDSKAAAKPVKQSRPPDNVSSTSRAKQPEAAPSAAPAGDCLPQTELLYQADTYCFANTATVLAVRPNESGSSWSVALDQTCFHAQGGGQPADSGSICSVDGSISMEVTMVKKDPAGVVWHDTASQPAFTVGSKVNCAVDEAFRRKNARLHSAGHLIDVAMAQSGCKLRPTKGYHFSPGSYVEYDGKLDTTERDALLPKVQAALDTLIADAIRTEVKTVEGPKLGQMCPPHTIPADPKLWGEGYVRVVVVGGEGCPCGGTHVADTKELGGVKVEAIKTKGKVTRVSYSMLD